MSRINTFHILSVFMAFQLTALFSTAYVHAQEASSTEAASEENSSSDVQKKRKNCYEEKDSMLKEISGTMSDDEVAQQAMANQTACDSQFPLLPATPTDAEARAEKREPNESYAILGYVYNTKTGSNVVIMTDFGTSSSLVKNVAANAQISASDGRYSIPKLDVRIDTNDYEPSVRILADLQQHLLPYVGAEFSRDMAMDRSWQLSGYAENRGRTGTKKWNGVKLNGEGFYGARAGFGSSGSKAFLPFVKAYVGGKGLDCTTFGDKDQHRVCVYTAAKVKADIYHYGYGAETGVEYSHKVNQDSLFNPYIYSVGGTAGVSAEIDYDQGGNHRSSEGFLTGEARF
jgi:hypothetical protein